jgi:hypothetical protein
MPWRRVLVTFYTTQEQEIRVRIPPGHKGSKKIIAVKFALFVTATEKLLRFGPGFFLNHKIK